MDDPSTADQILTVENIRKRYPFVCDSPDAVKCHVVGTEISSNETGDNFNMPCSENGLICLNSDQKSTSQCQFYQLTFSCPPEINECGTPGLAKCDPNAQCINTYGSYKCVCETGYSGDGKTCYKINQCVAWGDPHYVSFDQVVHHFMGVCSYRLTETCFTNQTLANGLIPFQITTANEHRGINAAVSFTKSVSLTVNNLTIELGENNILTIDQIELNPPQTKSLGNITIEIIYATKGIRIQTSFGLGVLFDGVSRVTVSVPDSYAGQMCGMCGNMNGNTNDEWLVGDGSVVTDSNLWGNSWISSLQDEPNCNKLNLTLPHGLCDSNSDPIVQTKCGILISPTGPFSPCHRLVDPQSIYPSCYFDMCSDPKNNDLLCSAYQIYADQCLITGILLDWRSSTGCTVKCGANEHYETVTSGCQASCDDPHAVDSCHLRDTSGCVCNDGFLRSGTTCTPKEQCGCYDGDNNYKAVGDIWFTDFCSTKNRCSGTNSVVKDPNVQCHEYGECFNSTASGESECRCKKGYEGRADNCTDIDECARGSYVCSDNGDCVNQLGTYNCLCKTGFVGNGLNCTDFNECESKTANCSAYATCYNTFGSYKCICQNGYEGNGSICSQIPIIAVNPDQTNCSFHQDASCDQLATCVDHADGSFTCDCTEGSFGDGLQGANQTGCTYYPCPQNSTAFEGYCYTFPPNSANQAKNEEICNNLGGHLATFTNLLALNFIKEQLQIFHANSPLHIGYSSSRFANSILPLDLSMTPQSNWATGHPKPDLPCTVILPLNDSQPFKFKSVNCSENYPPICKFPSSPRNCADGWLEVGNKCMTLFKNPSNVTDAIFTCSQFGADLTTILSLNESYLVFNRFLRLTTGSFWFGLNKNLLQRSFNAAFSNGKDLSFTNFNSSNPETHSGMAPDVECYQILSNGKWTNANCSGVAQGFLCEKPPNVFNRCPVTSEYFNGKCYRPLPKDTQPNSAGSCFNSGGELVSISTVGEQIYIESYMSSKNLWNSYWIGLEENQTKASFYSWSDGSVYEFTNWNSNEPGISSSGNCVIIDGSNSIHLPWSERQCNSSYPGFCEYVNTPCAKDSDCNKDGECHFGQCHCKVGFKGDGLANCSNINECLNEVNPCSINENCSDTNGSYSCNCKTDFVRLNNGTCQNKLFCLGDADCAKSGKCFQNLCSCNLGFEGDGKLLCKNVNECLNPNLNNCNESATCTDQIGSYTCKCNNGFQGDGTHDCHPTPKTCDEYLKLHPNSPSGVYTIDPDGAGPLSTIDVTCEMRPDIGITKISHDNVSPKQITSNVPFGEKRNITYEFPLPYILPIVNNSNFCYQDMEFQCQGFLYLLNTTNYIDVNGRQHRKWGTSTTENECGCGELNLCASPSQPCFCDGDYHNPGYDIGRIIDKTLLPLTGVLTGGQGYYRLGYISFGVLYCSPKPINLPKNCHDARTNYGMDKNAVIWIDVDGDGPFQPIKAFCDVTTKPIGVTIIPHDKIPGNLPQTLPTYFPGPLVDPSSPNTNPTTCFSYPAENGPLLKLIADSGACSQEVKYDCKEGSQLLNNVTYLQTLSGKILDYFGSGSNGKCACGVLNSCTNPKSNCNCDGSNSGSDFGFIRKKEDLPIKCITDNNNPSNPSNFTVGPLMCGPGPFGLEPSCNEWMARGYKANYTYLIDTDGGNFNNNSRNMEEFLVNCKIIPFPPQGITKVPISQLNPVCENSTDNLCKNPVKYPLTPDQIRPIIARSAFCQQKIKYTCQIMTLLKPYVGTKYPYSFWRTYGSENTNVNKSYFSGNGTNNATCDCGLDKSCDTCRCDIQSNETKVDEGYLIQKSDLPVGAVWIGMDQTNPDLISQIKLGDLECFETFPSCELILKGFRSTTEMYTFYNTIHTIDPDGPFGNDPIIVECSGTTTVVKPSVQTITIDDTNTTNIGPKAQCRDLQYTYQPHNKQLKELASISNACYQYMKLSCKATPLTNYVEWFDVDGISRPGWAGNSDGNECACGEVDSCQGGKNFSCNCDGMSTSLSYDHGLLVNKDILPVSKICLGLTERIPPPLVNRQIVITISPLYCSPTQNVIYPDCQALRENQYQDNYRKSDPRSEAWVIDPDSAGPGKPFTVYCDMKTDLPVGITVINLQSNPSLCSNSTLSSEEKSINLTYLAANQDNINNLTSFSSHCEQFVSYDCRNSPLFDGIKYGAYDDSQKYVEYWTGPNDKNSCSNQSCNCAVVDDKMRSDSGKFTDKFRLPLSSILMPSAPGQRKLCVKELRCYNLPKTCDEYNQLQRLDINKGNRNNIWAIDPDQAGWEEYFGVLCKTIDGVVVTETRQTNNPQAVNSSKSTVGNVSFIDTSPIQIQKLVSLSNYCSQRVDYFCTNSGTLYNKNPKMFDYQNKQLVSWAGADRYHAVGSCACDVLGNCPNNYKCRCDALSNSTQYEGGIFTDQSILPVQQVQYQAGQNILTNMYPVDCGSSIFDIPKDCIEARNKGFLYDTEVLIKPSGVTQPFLVFCQMNAGNNKNLQITMVLTNTTFSKTNQSVQITYPTTSVNDAKQLVKNSAYCIQPMKMNCKGIMFSSIFTWTDGSNRNQLNFGSNNINDFCPCGLTNGCAGILGESKSSMMSRQCSCDTPDSSAAFSDSVLITNKTLLPIKSFILKLPPNADPVNSLVIGSLMCSSSKIDFNECSTNFHDCDLHANCTNLDSGFRCDCIKGWQGLGGNEMYSNGRSCIDDDECALLKCPSTSDCTNTPGSFICNCHVGFVKAAPTVCNDINECSLNSSICDANADCINTYGSYICNCKPGFRGSGNPGDCEAVAICGCWGDPHCLSFDGNWLHYQGRCKYTLVRDECRNGLPIESSTANFEVIMKNWDQNTGTNSMVSWAKEITVKIMNYTIMMKIGFELVVDGQKTSIPFIPKNEDGTPVGFEVSFYGSSLRLTSVHGLEVKWDGISMVDVTITSFYMNNVCGLCGNYNKNPHDDWIVGPNCKPSGNITELLNLFGDSWRNDNPIDTDPFCSTTTCKETPNETPCAADVMAHSQLECQKLRDKFASCETVMKTFNKSLDEYIESCVYDQCYSSGDLTQMMCKTAESLAQKCLEEYKVKISYRSINFCNMVCNKNMIYSDCASPCQPTCYNNTNSMLCTGQCVESCICAPGYVLENGNCTKPEACGCLMSDGTYYANGEQRTNENCSVKCRCKGETGQLECTNITCSNDAFCDFKDDDYGCHCKNGFMGDGIMCKDIDECSNNTSVCDSNAFCKNTIGSFSCSCKEGFEGNGVTCTNINECYPLSPCDNATEECFDKVPGYECRCQKGFMKNTTTGNCDDRNECADTGNLCDRVSTNCNNTFGSYRCDCKYGFRPSPIDSFVCTDVNECNLVHECDKNYAKCTNTPGSYYCTCDSGYQGDGRNCTDIDECSSNKVCQRPDATCVNLPGSYECRCLDGTPGCDGDNPCNTVQCTKPNEICYLGQCFCKHGFQNNVTTNICEDIDECDTAANDCAGRKAKCANLDGSYECECLYGYRMSSINKICENINECIDNLHQCGENAECIDTDGGYYCQCKTGFTGHCDECRDIDECAFSLNNCDSDRATCENSIGSFTCRCNEGYSGDGSVCSEIDECLLGLHNCSRSHQFCFNVNGGFECRCLSGYKSDTNGSCVDENECRFFDNGCDDNADCINTDGSFLCICRAGYIGSGRNCDPQEGLEECGKLLCPLNALCVNSTCLCKSGYENSTNQCINTDECESQTSCDVNANCIDTHGSFICYCNEGYIGDGINCFKKDTDTDACQIENYCTDGDCYDGICHCPSGFVFKSNKCFDERCENVCPKNAICSISSGSPVCSCSVGTSLSSDSSQCIDIDECNENVDDCQENSICFNRFGSYDCKCPPNYLDVFKDGKVCMAVPLSQCNQSCPTGQYCNNGSCSCLMGLNSQTDDDGNLNCSKNSASCLPGICPLNANCEERLFGYICKCKPGYEGVGIKSCRDIDECGGKINNCTINEDCSNTEGSFTCSCKRGYSRNSSSGLCETNNMCNCGSHGICGPNYICQCKSGYEINPSGMCQDVNECQTQSPCHILAQCINTPGSYKCQCPENFYGDPQNKCFEDKCKTKALQCQAGEVCKLSLYGSVCEKISCNSSEILINNECLPVNQVCQNINCGNHAFCKIENGRADCFCDSGYYGDGELCVDVDECSNGDVSCPNNSFCQNKDGSFHCACNVGFQRLENALVTDSCTDIDECLLSESCATNGECQNTIGSFKCECKDGFIGDGKYDCRIDSKCEKYGGCHEDASCIVNVESSIYECQCHTEFSGDGITSCIKNNLCFVNGKSSCHENAICEQVNATYRCICPDGFQGDGYNFCNDIDECANDNTHNCSSLEKCVNSNGQYNCVCGDGAVYVDDICVDIDECSSNQTNKCSSNAICQNKEGTYSCQCAEGFYGDGLLCHDIDECKFGVANCSENALCINKPGTFACECQAGTLGNGTTCGDEDECKKPKGSPGAPECDENAVCKNKDPGYTCECQSGYKGTGWFCIKQTPCDVPNACKANQTCTPSNENSLAICECKPDFKLENDTCIPKTECENKTDNCDRETSNCVQLDPGFKCECKPGFNMVGNTCQDKNECDPTSPDFAAQKCLASGGGCLNTKGSFVCTCNQEQMNENNSSCKPIDSCAMGLDNCDRKVEDCISSKDSSYTCQCIEGFQRINGSCVDVDECADKIDSCKNNATCNNMIGSYVCKCPDNLKLDLSKKACTDRNECQENPMICGDLSKCLNTDGSYECQCVTGYKWNGTNCEDIDECAIKTHPCHDLARCSNVPGSCKCKCQPGFTGDGIYSCIETDSCPARDDVKCPTGSYCNMIGNFIYCNCTNGYEDSNQMECIGDVCYKKCSDIDECVTRKSACHKFAECTNNDGAYVCTCPSYLTGDGKTTCEDQNECALETHTCNLNTSYCENLDNTVNVLAPFQCHCFNGYVKIPGTQICLNKNECLNPVENDCVENAICIDTEGSYECRCKSGFKQLPSGKCENINECEEKSDNCSINSVCQDKADGFSCQCKPGFKWSDETNLNCEDIDECTNPTSCSSMPHSICMNNPGSFECVCPHGFSLQGGYCNDINECLIPNSCGQNSVCANTVSGFNCSCANGARQLPNGDCELINECLENIDRCQVLNGADSVCYDLPIGYACVCPDGFVNDEVFPQVCENQNECEINIHSCQASNSECVDTYGSFKCVCKPGFSKNSDGDCVDYDECEISEQSNMKFCNNGKCINTPGGFTCDCPEGFIYNNYDCIDVDECNLDQVSSLADNCDQVNGHCINTVGGFQCYCNRGFVMIENSTKCVDIDECQFPNSCLNGLCNNLPGSFECLCNKGYDLVNGKCTDINECSNNSQICGPQAAGICINAAGSFQCKCNVGYENSGGKSYNPCQSVNECVKLNITCPSNAQCVDRSNGYECICKDGYQEDQIGICRNINECQIEDSCHYLADCLDTDGSYKCTCKYGYKGDGIVSCKAICGPNSCLPGQLCQIVNGNQYDCGCVCQGPRCRDNGPVCDTQGITYQSEKQMFETTCKQNIVGEVEYYNECQKSCATVTCPGIEKCSMVNDRPSCTCQNCTQAELTPRLFCSNNGIEFHSICQMKTWICNTKSEISISYDGSCHRSIDCEVSEWKSWSSCSKTCGVGRYTRTRIIVKAAMFNGNCEDPLFETQQCYNGPCPGDACENITCAPGSFCESGKCICPDCSDQRIPDPVCGKIGDLESGTYRTFCTLLHNACNYNSSFTYLHRGRCGEHIPSEPKICSMVTHFQIVQSQDNCTSVEPVRVNLCSGGCGKNPNYCCRPAEERIFRSKFRCPDNSFVYREVKSISSCECKLEENLSPFSIYML